MSGLPDKAPRLTVDVIIELDGTDRIVLIERKFPPPGWAIPGGFVDYGETLEAAAVREAREETSLQVDLLEQFHTYSDPRRDPRSHTVATVYIARARGIPRGEDDAARAGVFTESTLPSPMAFDHGEILREYFAYKRTGKKPPLRRA